MLKQRPTVTTKVSNNPYKKELSPARVTLTTVNKQSPSPSSRNIKIKLVSPIKNKIKTDRSQQNCSSRQFSTRNHSPKNPMYKQIQSYSPSKRQLLLSNSNDQSNISIKQHFVLSPKYSKAQSPPKKYQPFILMKQNTSSHRRQTSPVKISINNKQFDLGTLKSQIIYVAPFHHVTTIHQPNKNTYKLPTSNQTSILWRQQLIIHEQNQAQSSKQTTHRSQLNQIQQLKEQLQSSTKRIKQILTNNKANQSICVSQFVYKQIKAENKTAQYQSNQMCLQDIPLEYSRLQTQNKIKIPTFNTEKTLINDLTIQTSQKLGTYKQEKSIQTERQNTTNKKEKTNLNIHRLFQHKIDCNFLQHSLHSYEKENSQFLSVQVQQNKQIFSQTSRLVIQHSSLQIQQSKDTSINTLQQTHKLCMTEQDAVFNREVEEHARRMYEDLIVGYDLEEYDQNHQAQQKVEFNPKINNNIYLL